MLVMNQSQTTVVNMDSVQKICLNPQTKKIWFFPINNTNGADLAEYDSVDKLTEGEFLSINCSKEKIIVIIAVNIKIIVNEPPKKVT